jgi:hypothetical protein
LLEEPDEPDESDTINVDVLRLFTGEDVIHVRPLLQINNIEVVSNQNNSN